MEYGTVQYSTVQYSTAQYSTVQYSTVQYSTVQKSRATALSIRQERRQDTYFTQLSGCLGPKAGTQDTDHRGQITKLQKTL